MYLKTDVGMALELCGLYSSAVFQASIAGFSTQIGLLSKMAVKTNKIPFWLVGAPPIWDVNWGYDLDFYPWPNRYPKWVALGSGNMYQDLRSISWCCNFDPHPNGCVHC